MDISYNTIEDNINKLQKIADRTKLKFRRDKNTHYDEMNYRKGSGNFHFVEDSFTKNVQGLAMIMHEALILMKFLQTNLQVESRFIFFFDFIVVLKV